MKLPFLISLTSFLRRPAPKSDFASGQAECHRLSCPFKANSDRAIIFAALQAGKRLTALTAFQLTGAVGADRRLREVRQYLSRNGVKLQSADLKSRKGGVVKQVWIDPKDLPERRKRKRGGR